MRKSSSCVLNHDGGCGQPIKGLNCMKFFKRRFRTPSSEKSSGGGGGSPVFKSAHKISKAQPLTEATCRSERFLRNA